MMIFPSFVMDPYCHSCLCLLLNSNVELLSFGKSGKISTFMAVWGVCSSIMFQLGLSLIKSSRRCFSSMESNAKAYSLARVPLARFALVSEICWTSWDKVLIETCLLYCIQNLFISVWHATPFIAFYLFFQQIM